MRPLKRVLKDPKVLQVFAKHHVTSCESLLGFPLLDLMELTDLPWMTVVEAHHSAARALAPAPTTAHDLRGRGKRFLPTSLAGLDESLHGGLPFGTITEVTGPCGTGKTQLCTMAAVVAALPVQHGGLGGGVIYIDTENAFTASRLVEMAQERFPAWFCAEDDPGNRRLRDLAQRVCIIRVSSCAELSKTLDGLDETAIEIDAKLLVVDSVAAVARREQGGRDRIDLLANEARSLKLLAERLNIAVLVTNQVENCKRTQWQPCSFLTPHCATPATLSTKQKRTRIQRNKPNTSSRTREELYSVQPRVPRDGVV
eukprot:m.166702 g.166702  ORF g.166702 m.166702 type:complete len:313 (-) comp17754_c0_seq1:536-1474(-)